LFQNRNKLKIGSEKRIGFMHVDITNSNHVIFALSAIISLRATEAVLMKDIMQSIIDTQLTCKSGLGWEGDRQCFRLPAGLDTKATVATVSEGRHSLPESVPPLPAAAEKLMVKAYIDMLNDAFGLNLDLDPCLARSVAEIAEQRESDATAKFIAVVGNSHARRLAAELEAIKAGRCQSAALRLHWSPWLPWRWPRTC
jgi:hypothetical protein